MTWEAYLPLIACAVVLGLLWSGMLKRRSRRRAGTQHRLLKRDGLVDTPVVRPEQPVQARRKAQVFRMEDVKETPEGE